GSHDAPTNMIVLGDSLYFVGVRPEESGGGLGLWKSDGTESGTTAVSGPFTWFPRGGSFSSLGNTFLFPVAESSIFGDDGELWRSDGTDAGTYQLRNIRVLNGSSSPSNLTALGDHVYFTTAADSGVGAG